MSGNGRAPSTPPRGPPRNVSGPPRLERPQREIPTVAELSERLQELIQLRDIQARFQVNMNAAAGAGAMNPQLQALNDQIAALQAQLAAALAAATGPGPAGAGGENEDPMGPGGGAGASDPTGQGRGGKRRKTRRGRKARKTRRGPQRRFKR